MVEPLDQRFSLGVLVAQDLVNPSTKILLPLILIAPLLSCGGERPIAKPAIDAEAAAAQAMELFDKNSDGALDESELKSSPGLAAGKTRADTNSDGRLSAEEIAARIQYWGDSHERIVCPELEFIFNRRRVPHADVIFEPEPFLATWLESLATSTDEMGRCTPQMSRELPGINMGYYRVKVSKKVGGKERLPAESNEQTKLGIEFCDDRPVEERFLIRILVGGRKRK